MSLFDFERTAVVEDDGFNFCNRAVESIFDLKNMEYFVRGDRSRVYVRSNKGAGLSTMYVGDRVVVQYSVRRARSLTHQRLRLYPGIVFFRFRTNTYTHFFNHLIYRLTCGKHTKGKRNEYIYVEDGLLYWDAQNILSDTALELQRTITRSLDHSDQAPWAIFEPNYFFGDKWHTEDIPNIPLDTPV